MTATAVREVEHETPFLAAARHLGGHVHEEPLLFVGAQAHLASGPPRSTRRTLLSTTGELARPPSWETAPAIVIGRHRRPGQSRELRCVAERAGERHH